MKLIPRLAQAIPVDPLPMKMSKHMKSFSGVTSFTRYSIRAMGFTVGCQDGKSIISKRSKRYIANEYGFDGDGQSD
jgi:hypothetical protein